MATRTLTNHGLFFRKLEVVVVTNQLLIEFVDGLIIVLDVETCFLNEHLQGVGVVVVRTRAVFTIWGRSAKLLRRLSLVKLELSRCDFFFNNYSL